MACMDVISKAGPFMSQLHSSLGSSPPLHGRAIADEKPRLSLYDVPPPLTPPHKGEGDFRGANLSKMPLFRRQRGKERRAAAFPPPCGEG
ncbi:hypothetical protein IQ26_02469 [Mesorhizobium tianshanense]|uniref:Uncharacterized protein n=1 Tax=Mesorhizobium tianshanense TaxID=39844 RepID=A0A562NZD8_9HYPH|nr:hypothetical protein IQ26_02469 [Mesorhizobium tianshanense]